MKIRRKPGVPRKGLQRDTSGEEYGLTGSVTCLERIAFRINTKPVSLMNDELKICTKCGIEKAVRDDFYPNRKSRRVRPRCKACMDEDHKEYIKRRLETDPAYNRNKYARYVTKGMRRKYLFKKMYDITLEQYEQMFEEQKGLCAICGLPMVRGNSAVVDHSHKTGKVRGLLHRRCNSALGTFRDSPDVCRRAAEYLEKNLG